RRSSDLFLAGAGEELVHAHDLAMKCSGNKGFALDFARDGISDGDAVDLEGAAESALIIGLGFLEVGQSANFRALSVDQITLSENDVVKGRGTQLVLLLLRVKSLLLEFARLTGRLDLGAILGEGDVSIADVQKRSFLQLLHLCFELPLHH